MSTTLSRKTSWPGFPPQALPLDSALEVEPARRAALPATAPGSEAATLRRVLMAVERPGDPQSAVRGALAVALEVTDADIGSLWLLASDGTLARAAHARLPAEYLQAFAREPRWQREHYVRCRRSDVTLCVDLPASESLRLLGETTGVRSMLSIPLRARGLRVGALFIGHRRHDGFAPFSLELLRAIGELLGTALDDARAAQERFARILQSLDTGVALLGPLFEVIEHNPAFAALVAPQGSGTLTGRTLAELLPELAGSELAAALATALAEGGPVTLAEVPAPLGGLPRAWWSATAAPLVSDGAAPAERLVLTLADVSERHAREDRYRHSQKMEAIGTLAGGIAHEFNNLLTAILGNVSLALLDLPARHPLVAGLRDCELAAERAAELTRQLLGFSRRSPLRSAPCDLRDVLDEALPLIERSIDPRITLTREFAPDLWSVHADAAQVAQLVVHLCVNARDAMPAGGALALRLANRPSRGAYPDSVVLEVADTGAGIPPEVLARMYEPFFTTKGPDRGTGLGLAVVHGIVEQHGGWIECETLAQRGTTFRVHLPRLDPGARATQAGTGEIIMVIEDEDVLRGLARVVLERLGYRVITAHDGLEAIALFRGGVVPALVLLDLTMPRLTGAETLRELRRLLPGVAVILTSGYAGQGERDATMGGADGFLPKPYSADRLGSVVREVLDARG